MRCDVAAWRLFGISLAGYNAIFSLGAAILGAYLADQQERLSVERQKAMSAKAPRKPRPAPPGVAPKEEIAAMIRVDHAGEYGAVRIYEGQLAVFAARQVEGEDRRRHHATWPSRKRNI